MFLDKSDIVTACNPPGVIYYDGIVNSRTFPVRQHTCVKLIDKKNIGILSSQACKCETNSCFSNVVAR